jgi:AP-1 complex subunit beta-1
MAVNGFVKDCGDPNPLIRALAVRTMGCIRVDKISEYLCEPLRRALKDSDPYVRKTAAICVPKLYEVSPDLVEDQGFIDYLVELMSDSNPSVVSNSLAALNEIRSASTVWLTREESASPSTLISVEMRCQFSTQVSAVCSSISCPFCRT